MQCTNQIFGPINFLPSLMLIAKKICENEEENKLKGNIKGNKEVTENCKKRNCKMQVREWKRALKNEDQ